MSRHKFAILSYMKSLSLNQPHVIVMVGVPGSGKSFFAEKFAETFHAPYVCRGRIETLVGDNPAADALAMQQFTELLKTRHTLILEGPSSTRAERTELSRLAQSAGYETLFVWVQTDPATAKMRSIRPSKDSTYRPLTHDEYDAKLQRFSAPHAVENTVVISGKHTYATQARVVLKKLSSPRAAIAGHSRPPIRAATPAVEPRPDTRRNITIQ